MSPLQRRSKRRNEPDDDVVILLFTRAQARCEVCGTDLSWGAPYSKHHRWPRGRGGPNTIENLLLLCGTGTTGCHGRIESYRTDAYDNGWLIRTGYAPAEVPVTLHGSRIVYLADDGRYAEVAA